MTRSDRFRSRLTGSIVEIDATGPIEPDGHDGVHFHYVEIGKRDKHANVKVGDRAWFARSDFDAAFTSEQI